MPKSNIKRLYQSVDMPIATYFTRYALPLVIAGVGLAAALVFLFPDLVAQGIFRYFFLAVPFLFSLIAILFPLLQGERKKMQIERNLHLFLIRMSVLAT
jgi:archaellum biogenesis protein FlaJ (TadC family)